MDESGPDRRIVYRGRKIDLALQAVRLADGSEAEREVVLHRGAVALVPMVDEGRVCLVTNRRYAVGRTLLEVPAGTLEPGESPEQTAARELREETGLRVLPQQLRTFFLYESVFPPFLTEGTPRYARVCLCLRSFT